MSEIFALAAAVCIATSSMFINELNGKVDLVRLARWQMTAGALMTGAVSVAIGGWRTVGPMEFGYLAASSLFGIVIGNVTYLGAIYMAGARLTALLFSLTAPLALVMGYFFLGEVINAVQGVGIVLVITGILLAIGIRGIVATRGSGNGEASNIPWRGISLGAFAALLQAFSSLLARPAMAAGTEPFTAMLIRAGIGCLFFAGLALVPLPALRQTYLFQPRHLLLALCAALFGMVLGMSLLMAALVEGDVGIVSTLSSMTPIVILPMVWIRTGVIPPVRAWIGAAFAVAGTALISLG